jgi:hypothetical protein
LVAELDVPGEYFADRSEGTLYWKPPSLSQLLGASRLEASQAAGAAGVVSLLPHVVSIVNASDITFSGIALLHARGNGVDAVHSRGLALSDCVLANHGNLAVKPPIIICNPRKPAQATFATIISFKAWEIGRERCKTRLLNTRICKIPVHPSMQPAMHEISMHALIQKFRSRASDNYTEWGLYVESLYSSLLGRFPNLSELTHVFSLPVLGDEKLLMHSPSRYYD